LMTFFEVAEEALGGLALYYHDPTKRRHIVMRQAFAFLVRALFWNMELNRGLCICIVFRNMISSRRLKGRWGPRPSGGPFQTFLQMWDVGGSWGLQARLDPESRAKAKGASYREQRGHQHQRQSARGGGGGGGRRR
jgi:hypothetical protein